MSTLGDPGWNEFPAYAAYLAFGAMVSATDPVAVVSLLKELGAPKQLATLIEGESLLNDGTAYVIFVIFIDIMTKSYDIRTDQTAIFIKAMWLVFGGIITGWGCGAICMMWIRRCVSPSLSLSLFLSLSLAFLSFFLFLFLCVPQTNTTTARLLALSFSLWLPSSTNTTATTTTHYFY